MKKVFNTILALLLLLGVMGCSNGITDSTLTVPSPEPEVIGIQIPLNEVPTGSTNLKIFRKKSSDAEYPTSRTFEVSYSEVKNNEFICDYYYDCNVEYDYKVVCDDPSTTTFEKKNLKGTSGFGELGFDPNSTFSYNDGIVSFDKDPLFENHTYRRADYNKDNPDWMRYNMKLKVKTADSNDWVWNNSIKFSLKTLGNMQGKTANFNGFEFRAWYNNIQYYYNVEGEDNASKVLPNMPKTFAIPEVSKPLKAEATANGIKLTITPQNVKDATAMRIRRWCDDNRSNFDLITHDLSKTEIIDYFVIPNNNYHYEVQYINEKEDNFILENSKNSEKVTATAGSGELQLTNERINYSINDQGKMTFNCLKNVCDAFNKVEVENKHLIFPITYSRNNYELTATINPDNYSIYWYDEFENKYPDDDFIEKNYLYQNSYEEPKITIGDVIYIVTTDGYDSYDNHWWYYWWSELPEEI